MNVRKWVPYLLAVVAVMILYYSFDWAVGAVIHNRQVVTVPDLTGKTISEALNILSAQHLALTKDGEQFDKSFPAGVVVRQNPVRAMSVREGRIVHVTLSQGGETLFVPDLVGQPLRNAQTALQNAGLSIGEMDHRPSLRFDKDQVMSTDPPSGATVSKNAIVNVVVSDGSPAADILLVPDFSAKALPDAQAWATEHQITLTQREENDPARPSGAILQQAPTADTPMRAGDELTLVVNNSASAPGQGPHVHYQIPLGGDTGKDVRVVVVDATGEHQVFRSPQAPGSLIDVPVQPQGRARARIFVNGVMVQEQSLP